MARKRRGRRGPENLALLRRAAGAPPSGCGLRPCAEASEVIAFGFQKTFRHHLAKPDQEA